jgi:alpha-beta hydrolase superfamily lysophospholipase
LLLLIALGFGGAALFNRLETEALATGPNGPTTPATVGLKYERVAIESHGRTLDGYLVRADAAACEHAPAILIFHGLKETISQWVGAQLFLHDHCVSSLVFDYAGSGDSSKPGSIAEIDNDAPAVYAFARKAFADAPLFVLGHAQGNGPMLEAAAGFKPKPSGIIVANAFASLRGVTARSKAFGLLAPLLPDWWDNVIAVVGVRAPLLVVCSDTDTVNPVDDSRDIYAAAAKPKSLAVLHGLAHNALYRTPDETWWQPVLTFITQPPTTK